MQSSSGDKLYAQSTLANSLRRSKPACPSFSAIKTVGFEEMPSAAADAIITSRGGARLWLKETENREERDCLEDSDSLREG